MGIVADAEIAGKLRLVSPLGQGSSGQVWLARHVRLGSEVAVKFLNREVSEIPTAKERFLREARTVARLRSPHVVQVHDFGFHEGYPYLVMEHLVGETLEDRLQRVGALPAEQVVRICTQIAKALQRAHDAGIIHRDIKPANVFLVDYGDEEIAKVVDFGIVKAADSSLSTSTVQTLTETGSLLGTPYYMSPEQIQDSGAVGPESDLWALGVIAFECMVGRLPFSAPNFPRLVMAICRDPIPAPSDFVPVPPAFDVWMARALQRDRTQRFASAKELARELYRALILTGQGDFLAMPDGAVPPDLLWSGAYQASGASPSNHDGLSDSAHRRPSLDIDHPPDSDSTVVDPPSDCPRPGIPEVVFANALLPPRSPRIDGHVSQDGSLSSQVSTDRPLSSLPLGSRASRFVVMGLAAAALLAVGWFASRYSLVVRDAAAPASNQAAPPIATQQPAPVESPAAPKPPEVVASSSAAASASVALPAVDAAPPRAVTPPTAKAPPPAAPPTETSAPADTAAPPPKRLDPLEERQ